jgi:phosphoribosylformimino-5-aminoimidazole carboxamide ribotide isomerase
LGNIAPIPTTYAGGVRSQTDIDVIDRLGHGRLDFTVGSALDIFGGTGLNYEQMAAINRAK